MLLRLNAERGIDIAGISADSEVDEYSRPPYRYRGKHSSSNHSYQRLKFHFISFTFSGISS